MSITKNYLLGYDNMYIYQDNEMFNFSLDSVLLANFVTINKSDTKIMDINSLNGEKIVQQDQYLVVQNHLPLKLQKIQNYMQYIEKPIK